MSCNSSNDIPDILKLAEVKKPKMRQRFVRKVPQKRKNKFLKTRRKVRGTVVKILKYILVF